MYSTSSRPLCPPERITNTSPPRAYTLPALWAPHKRSFQIKALKTFVARGRDDLIRRPAKRAFRGSVSCHRRMPGGLPTAFHSRYHGRHHESDHSNDNDDDDDIKIIGTSGYPLKFACRTSALPRSVFELMENQRQHSRTASHRRLGASNGYTRMRESNAVRTFISIFFSLLFLLVCASRAALAKRDHRCGFLSSALINLAFRCSHGFHASFALSSFTANG